MAKLTIGKGGKGKDVRRGRMPTKTSINLVQVDQKKPKFTIAIPAIILIIVGAAAFSKYFVIDRFAERDAAVAEVVKLRNQMDDLSDALKQYADVEEIYAHYTKDAMTADELSRVDRVRILQLINSVLQEGAGAKTWSVTGNILTIEFEESTLGVQNELARKIEESSIVDSCIIKRADKDKKQDQDEKVRATFTVYLKQPEEEEETEEEAAGTAAEDSSENSSEEPAKEDSPAGSAEDSSAVDSSKEAAEDSLGASTEEPSEKADEGQEGRFAGEPAEESKEDEA